MSILDDLEIHINNSGLVADYEQTTFFNESNYPNKTVSYRVNGGSGSDYLVRNQTVDFTVFGADSAAVIGSEANEVYTTANALFEYFNDNYQYGCIVGILLFNEVTSPERTDTDRPFCTFTIQLKIAR